MSFRDRLQSWRYNLVPDHVVGEILTKRWTDNAIPFLALVATLATFGSIIPGFFKLTALQESTRQLGEFSMVVTGETVHPDLRLDFGWFEFQIVGLNKGGGRVDATQKVEQLVTYRIDCP